MEFQELVKRLASFKIKKKCTRNIWMYKIKFTRFNDVSSNGTRVGLFMPSKELEIIQQVRLYTMTNFIADFGGYLGLLLGASMMSLFDLILKCIQIFRQKHQTDLEDRSTK